MPNSAPVKTVSRRSVLRAAAWALPAVAVAVATPALAASAEGGDSPLQYNLDQSSAFGSVNGGFQIQTHVSLPLRVHGVPLPSDHAEIVCNVRVVNESGEIVFDENHPMIVEERPGGFLQHNQVIANLPAGTYSVTWQVLSAVDSDNRVLQPSNLDGWTKRVEATVTS